MNDNSVTVRVLCEQVGIFDIRQQEEMSRLFAFYIGRTRAEETQAVEHLVKRWEAYQAAQKRDALYWAFGTAHKFFMSGKWDDPDTWPWRPGMKSDPAEARRRVQARMEASLRQQQEWEAHVNKIRAERRG